ncbi:putative disease resistance protein RGA3 [Coffea eugenioides]|uniref:putative disease resistance protein RGA3 n=1 Tax=Coffea eugenioides TaxID=49369 RepID=UPI000F60F507|nr:putative disease resistance protein RGA3 [Coffea eugenioides]
MADALVAASIQIVLEKLVSATTDVIGVAFGGFKEELEKLKGSVAMIQAVMADAEKKQVQNQDVQLWLKRLEGVAFDADNLLDEINYEFLRRRMETQNRLKQKVCLFFSTSCTFAFRWRMASKVKNLNMKLKSINQEAVGFGLSRSQMGGGAYVSPLPAMTMSRETDSVARQNVVGRATDASNIVGTLLSSSAKVVSVIPITGLGGLGKTTLAQLVYNDPEINRQFDKKIWVCVSRNFEVTRLFKLILESLTKRKADVESREPIVQEVRREIEGKRYLLVLDDVWNERSELWEDFIHSLVGISTTNGNWILVTTRNIEVATRVATHPPYSLGKLGDDDCWSIVKEKVFPSGEVPKELEALKSRIIKRCQGLPLAATVIGGLLRFKRKEEWLAILESGFARLGGEESSVMQLLKLSFDHLPSASIKKCFAYCSIAGKGSVMSRQKLTLLWMAEGFLQPRFNEVLEDIGKEHFDILLQSSLFEEVATFGPFSLIGDRNCTMHDFVHDLAQSVLRSDSITDENCRYLLLPSFDGETQENLKSRSSSLRTLLGNGTIESGEVFLKLKYLRVLQLPLVTSQELPTSISKLIHLRFLDLSHSRFKALPESICKLYNLQTLVLSNHFNPTTLKELPDGMRNLINLRHLLFFTPDSKFRMPKGMGQLTCLQTLQFFNIGKEEGCKIEEVGCLKNLRGQILIRNLEFVNAKREAHQEDLLSKPNLNDLAFEWGSGREGDYNDEDVLEGLLPHPNLQSLYVKNYMGSQFPRWLMNMSIAKYNMYGSLRRLDRLVKLIS